MDDSEWQPGTPESKRLAGGVLAGALDEWLTAGVGPLTFASGWPLDVPAGSSELWATLVCCAVRTGERVARWSEVSRQLPFRPEAVEELAQAARAEVARFAAAVLIELGLHVDRDAVVVEARQFVDEVDDEDDGVAHATDALASLLQARWLCAEDGVELPAAELARAAVAILSPLLAQNACLLTRRAPR